MARRPTGRVVTSSANGSLTVQLRDADGNITSTPNVQLVIAENADGTFAIVGGRAV